MLTKQDLRRIELLLDVKLDEKLDEKLDQKLREHLGNFPTKDEFYRMMDKLMGELDTSRNEQVLLARSQEDHEERLDL